MQRISFIALICYSVVAGQRWYISSIDLLIKYLRKNFFDTHQELRYPIYHGDLGFQWGMGGPFETPFSIDRDSIGFSNKSILFFDKSGNSIFVRQHHNWIERKVSNRKYGQIVTLKNFTGER